MADLGILQAHLELQSAQFERGVKRVEKSMGGLDRVANQVSKSIGAMIPAVTLGAVSALISKNLELQSSFGRLRDRLGFTTESLSAIKFQLEANDVSFQSATIGLQRFVRGLGEAAGGTGAAVGALKTLGLVSTELVEMAPDKAFLKTVDALSKVDNKSQQVLLTMQLFGAENVKLLQTMQDGAKGFEDAADQAERFGAVITDDMANAAINARGQFDLLALASTGAANQLTAFFTPVISALAREIVEDVIPSLTQLGGTIVRIANGGAAAMFKLAEASTTSFSFILKGARKLNDMLPEFMQDEDARKVNADRIASVDALTKRFKVLSAELAQLAIHGPKVPPVIDDAGEAAGRAGPTFGATAKTAAQLAKEAAAAAKALEMVRKASEKASKEQQELRGAIEDWRDSLRETVQRNLPEAMRATDAYTETMEDLRLALQLFPEDADDIRAAMANVAATFEASKDSARDLGVEVERDLPEAFKTASNAIQGGFRDLFGDIFRGVSTDFEDMGARIKDFFIDLLAEMAALAATRAVVIPIVGAITGASAASLAGLVGGNSGGLGELLVGGAGSLLGGIFSAADTSFGAYDDALSGGGAAGGFLQSVGLSGISSGISSALGIKSGGFLGGLFGGGGAGLGASILGGVATAGLGFLASSALSSLFGKDEDFPYGIAEFNAGSNSINRTFTLDGQDGSALSVAAQSALDRINEIEKEFGLKVVNSNLSVGISSGRSGALPSGFFSGFGTGVGSLGDFSGIQGSSGLGSIEDAVNASIARAFGADSITQLDEMIRAIEGERKASTDAADALSEAAFAQRDGLIAEIEARARLSDGLGDLRLDLLAAAGTSTLPVGDGSEDAESRFAFFEGQLFDAAELARTGDQEALAEFSDVARRFLDVAEQDFASSGLGRAGKTTLGLLDDILAGADELAATQQADLTAQNETINERTDELLAEIAAESAQQTQLLQDIAAGRTGTNATSSARSSPSTASGTAPALRQVDPDPFQFPGDTASDGFGGL